LLKSLYLTTIDVQKKWTRRIPHWEQILSQLTIMYGKGQTKKLNTTSLK